MSDSSMERWPDDRLLREANRGNTKAFVQFCVRSLPSLRRYVRFQLFELDVPSDLVDDFCHDAILRAVDHINSCREHGDRPLPSVSVAWIKQIAFNAIKDWQRKNKRLEFVADIAPESRTTTTPDEVDEYEEIVKFFQWLSPNEHDMLDMVFVGQMPIVDAGECLNLSKAAAYKTFERGLQHLRDLLQEHGKFMPSRAL